MQLRAEEISNIIKQQIAGYDKAVDVMETGTILTVGDGIARVYGLDSAMAGELVEFPGKLMGMVLNLEEDNVGVAIFGSDVTSVKEGDDGQANRSHRGGTGREGTHWPRGERARSARRREGAHRDRRTSRRVEIKAPGIIGPPTGRRSRSRRVSSPSTR